MLDRDESRSVCQYGGPDVTSPQRSLVATKGNLYDRNIDACDTVRSEIRYGAGLMVSLRVDRPA
jgi:hypothetical protein